MPYSHSPHRPPYYPWIAALLLIVGPAVAGLAGCGGDDHAGVDTRSATARDLTTASFPIAVLTQRYDAGCTGLDSNETQLTPASVSPATGSFAKRSAATVDGAVYAQPLLVPNLSIGGYSGEVVFVATEHDSVYALRADTLTMLWQAKLVSTTYGADPATTTVSSSDVRCSDISPEYGITGTPVIDAVSGTLYVVSNTKEGKHTPSIVYRLHALDILTGLPKHQPVTIQATVPGTGAGSRRGVVTFNPSRHLQRPGLLLLPNGTLAIGFSGHCDVDPYHGWVMTYDAASLAPKAAWTTAPNGTEAGVWMSGAGLAADDAGFAYVSIGNGTFDGSTAFGNSVVRLDLAHLDGAKPVIDFFTPYDQAMLSSKDLDLGSGGVLLVPDPQASRHVAVVGGKTGTVYLLDRTHLGGYSTSTNQNLQFLPNAAGGGLFATPAYWNGNVYFQGKGQPVQAYSFDATTGLLAPMASWQNTSASGFPGASPVVSANGSTGAIVWTLQTDGYGSGAAAILHAFDATSGAELYSSATLATDAAGPAVKFAVPLVANGSVYVGGVQRVTRYGL